MKSANILLLSCLFLFLTGRPCLAVSPGPATEDFRWAATVLLAKNDMSYTSVRLTPPIIGHANPDLSDIRLMAGGQAVPYFINSYAVTGSLTVMTYELAPADSYNRDSFQYLDYKLSSEYSDDITATALHIAAAGQFVKDIALYGSYDGTHWDFIKNDSVYQVEGGRKLSVSLLPGEKYTRYRLRLSGNQEPVSFSRVWLEYNLDTVSKDYFVETLTPAMSVRQEGKTTVVALDGLKNLTLSEIELQTGDMFKREVYVNGSARTLYNLVFAGGGYRDLTIPMNGYQCLSDRLELQIHNGDDLPIQPDAVAVSYLAYDVVFQNTQTPVTLYFGGDEHSAPPRYDIMSYKEYILAEGYSRSAVGEISESPVFSTEEEETAAPDYTPLFNITIVAAAVLLTAVLVTRLKKIK
ncbi:MAG: hypothetical protein LBK56_15210 [Gracilibacteraceae bacterium]|nr:hypothetical protein [Gracilibacteraceae bacterium]